VASITAAQVAAAVRTELEEKFQRGAAKTGFECGPEHRGAECNAQQQLACTAVQPAGK